MAGLVQYGAATRLGYKPPRRRGTVFGTWWDTSVSVTTTAVVAITSSQAFAATVTGSAVDGTVTAIRAVSATLFQAPVITGETIVIGGAPGAATTAGQYTGGNISVLVGL